MFYLLLLGRGRGPRPKSKKINTPTESWVRGRGRRAERVTEACANTARRPAIKVAMFGTGCVKQLASELSLLSCKIDHPSQ